MMANDFVIDYERVRAAVRTNYPRASVLPGAGFAAGPCLVKDTMQLAAFNNNNFNLGQDSVNVNEGLPLYVVAKMEQSFDLAQARVGILGMSFFFFQAEDGIRDYKVTGVQTCALPI